MTPADTKPAILALALCVACLTWACSDTVGPAIDDTDSASDTGGADDSPMGCGPDPSCPDRDGDGFFVSSPCCVAPPFPVDCDDTDDTVNALAPEVCGDRLDNDCNDIIDDPALCEECEPECEIDEAQCSGRTAISYCSPVDGCPRYASPVDCRAGEGCREGACVQVCVDADRDGFFVDCDGQSDCDDGRADVYPQAPELCDGRDNNCDRRSDENFVCDDDCVDQCTADSITCSADGAGFVACELASNGCRVQTGLVLCPYGSFCSDGQCGAEPVCYDPDGDGYGANCTLGEDDCLPIDAAGSPTGHESCDRRDNDCDGRVDEDATCDECAASSASQPIRGAWGVPFYRVACGAEEVLWLGPVAAGDELTVSALGPGGPILFDAGAVSGGSFSSWGSAQVHGETGALIITAPRGGEVAVRVRVADGTPYSVVGSRKQPGGCAPDILESNDSPGTGTPIGAVPFGRVGTVCGTDRDFFTVPRPDGEVLVASVVRDAGADQNLTVSIMRNGVTVSPGFAGVPAEGGFPIEHHAFVRLDLPGEYAIGVAGFTANADNDYALLIDTLDALDCVDDVAELNEGVDDDTIATARALAPGTTFSGVLCPGDYDIIEVGRMEGGAISGTLTHGADTNLDVRMLRDSWIGLVQDARTDGTSETLNNAISSPGTYYIAIFGRTALDGGAYTFRYSR